MVQLLVPPFISITVASAILNPSSLEISSGLCTKGSRAAQNCSASSGPWAFRTVTTAGRFSHVQPTHSSKPILHGVLFPVLRKRTVALLRSVPPLAEMGCPRQHSVQPRSSIRPAARSNNHRNAVARIGIDMEVSINGGTHGYPKMDDL